MAIREGYCKVVFGPPRISGVFEVCDVVHRTRQIGTTYIEMTLSLVGERWNAIAATPAIIPVPGELVHVSGCVLLRQGEPVVVICSLRTRSHHIVETASRHA